MMSVSAFTLKIITGSALMIALAPAADAALTLRFNPADLNQPGPGPLTADVGVLINWDGSGTNLIAGINFDVTVPASVTLPDTTPPNPLGFNLASVLNRSVAFASFTGNVAPLANGDTLLTTLRFNVNAVAGDFPIGLTIVSAEQGNPAQGNFVDITNQVSATGGVLRVAAVPEPSALSLLGLLTLTGCCGWRKRR